MTEIQDALSGGLLDRGSDGGVGDDTDRNSAIGAARWLTLLQGDLADRDQTQRRQHLADTLTDLLQRAPSSERSALLDQIEQILVPPPDPEADRDQPEHAIDDVDAAAELVIARWSELSPDKRKRIAERASEGRQRPTPATSPKLRDSIAGGSTPLVGKPREWFLLPSGATIDPERLSALLAALVFEAGRVGEELRLSFGGQWWTIARERRLEQLPMASHRVAEFLAGAPPERAEETGLIRALRAARAVLATTQLGLNHLPPELERLKPEVVKRDARDGIGEGGWLSRGPQPADYWKLYEQRAKTDLHFDTLMNGYFKQVVEKAVEEFTRE